MSSKHKLALIFVAGGTGSRMQSATPKQYLHLNKKPIFEYSLNVFGTMPNVEEIVVVCAPQYQPAFLRFTYSHKIKFAAPGKRRQDSVYNGFNAVSSSPQFIAVHDAVRPFISHDLVNRVLGAATTHGAATAAMPVKFTVKESNSNGIVVKTPDRSLIWEIQTPQIIETTLLKNAFSHALKHDLTVTDDVSLVELLNLPVKLVEGCYRNLKITTPDDLDIANAFLKESKKSEI